MRGGFKCSGKEDDGFGKSADRQLHNLSPVNIPCSDNWKYHSLRIVATCTSRLNRNANDNKSWLQHQASWVGESLVDKFTFRDSLRPRWAGRRFWQIFRYCWQQRKTSILNISESSSITMPQIYRTAFPKSPNMCLDHPLSAIVLCEIFPLLPLC